jgi:hypothetical protein
MPAAARIGWLHWSRLTSKRRPEGNDRGLCSRRTTSLSAGLSRSAVARVDSGTPPVLCPSRFDRSWESLESLDSSYFFLLC